MDNVDWIAAVTSFAALALSCWLLVRDHLETRRAHAFELFQQWSSEEAHRLRNETAIRIRDVAKKTAFANTPAEFQHCFGYLFHKIISIDQAVTAKFMSKELAKQLFAETFLAWRGRWQKAEIIFTDDDNVFGKRIEAAMDSISKWATASATDNASV